MYMIGRFLSLLSKSASMIGAVCVVLMMLHVTADVVGRYVFNTPLPGTIVIVANYYMIILAFIALGVTEEKRGHVSVDIFYNLFPKKAQTGLSALGGLFTVAVIGALMIAGWSEAVKKTKAQTTMEQGSSLIEVWQSYWAIPIGAGLMLLIAAYHLVTTLTGARSGLDDTNAEENFIND